MQIDHGGRQPPVAHEYLDFSDIVAGFQQMSCKRMPHGMNAGTIFNAGFFAGLFIKVAHRFVRQRLVLFMLVRRGEQIGLGPEFFVIMAQFRQQSFGQQ